MKTSPDHRAADMDSLSDLGLFNLPQAAGRTLMSMAVIASMILSQTVKPPRTALKTIVNVKFFTSISFISNDFNFLNVISQDAICIQMNLLCAVFLWPDIYINDTARWNCRVHSLLCLFCN